MPSTSSHVPHGLQPTAQRHALQLEPPRRMRCTAALCLALAALALAGCSSTHYQGTDTTASGRPSTGSGVQVFGTMDAGVVHQR